MREPFEPFVSFAQNGEDIVLWRALGHVRRGCYLDVGAADPLVHSVTRAFYLRGWRGINVEPVADFAAALRRDRPEDVTVAKAAGARPETDRSFFVLESTGLSTLLPDAARHGEEVGYRAKEISIGVETLDHMLEAAGFAGQPLHFCKIDVEGAETEVLAGFDLGRWRPWVLVVEATMPTSSQPSHSTWERGVLDAGYDFCLFDGLNRFYVARERSELASALSVPANILDGWRRYDAEFVGQEDHLRRTEARAQQAEADVAPIASLDEGVAELSRQALRWRDRAQTSTAEAADLEHQLAMTRGELAAVRRTVSWHVTEPLRRARPTVRSLEGRVSARRRRVTALETNDADRTGPAQAVPEDLVDPELVAAVAARLEVVTGLLSGDAGAAGPPENGAAGPALEDALTRFAMAAARTALPYAVAWLAWLAATGSLPDEAELDLTRQRLALDGADGLAAWVASRAKASESHRPGALATIRVLRGGVAVDVTHTASWNLHTGVQRVVRETATRWTDDHDATLFAWDYARGAPFALPPDEVNRFRMWRQLLDGDPTQRWDPVAATDEVLVPWRGTILIPELPTESARADRYRALARAAILDRLGGIGYDLIPVTANETLAAGMSDAFSELLGVVKYLDRLSGISASSAHEFRAFASMLGAQGLRGPDVAAHSLPSDVPAVTDEVLEQVRNEWQLGSIPMVLVVGSHEPRKNHAVVLLAAERLWREGRAFHLVFLGGSGWRGERFDGLVGELVAAGRSVQVVKRASEKVLGAAYHLARFSVFPSLAEGFGLPVAESLASATPVITSNFGSMDEIGRQGGALLVDPRSVDDVTTAMRCLLTDDDLLDRLQDQARDRPQRSWDDYAQDTWTYLTT